MDKLKEVAEYLIKNEKIGDKDFAAIMEGRLNTDDNVDVVANPDVSDSATDNGESEI